MTTTNPPADYLDHFRARVLQDALNEATAAYWLRRAETFEDARTRPGGPPEDGTSPGALDDRRRAATAQACRNKAAFIEMYPGEIEDLVRAALAEAHAATTTETTNSSTDRSAA